MKADPKAVLQKLRTRRMDPDSTAALDMVEEVAERVLRNLAPPEDSLFAPLKEKASGI